MIIEVLEHGVRWGQTFVLVYFFAVNSFYLLLLANAAAELRRHRARVALEERWRILGSDVAPSLSVIAPAFNEEATVTESVRALLMLRYPNLEIVLVSDGSSDATLDVLIRDFELVPVHPAHEQRLASEPVRGVYQSTKNKGLVVVDKVNGGKADALNTGLNIASGELVCAIDADTLIEPEALILLSRPFLTQEGVVATGGTIRVANGSTVRGGRVTEARVSTRLLPGIQTVEYLRAYLFGRLGWNRLGGNLIISGALGLFHKDTLIDAGGYLHASVGEDLEIVARIRRNGALNGSPARVAFVPDPVAWTEVPSSLGPLGRQRDRWHRGLADVMWRYRGVLGRKKYGALGLLSFPYFVFVELLAPVIEAFGLVLLVLSVGIGMQQLDSFGYFVLVVYGYGLVLNGVVIVLDEFGFRRYDGWRNRALLFWWAQIESLGYRQLTVFWRLKGIVNFLRKKTEWGAMTRTGFTVVPPSESELKFRAERVDGS
jgi:cellulose synthase/poly-beta-1,6-N-acetylglucosamine synthase-like glycosyltransferase